MRLVSRAAQSLLAPLQQNAAAAPGAWCLCGSTRGRLFSSSNSTGSDKQDSRGPDAGGVAADLADEFRARLTDVEAHGSSSSSNGEPAAAAGPGPGSQAAGEGGAPHSQAHGPPPPASGGDGGSSPLLHERYGFAVLGGINPDDEAAAEAGAEQPRIHPRREFEPGHTYEPQDLNPFGDDGAELNLLRPTRTHSGPPLPRRMSRQERREWEAQVTANLDYKNVRFLQQFVTGSGRLKGRRHTQLPPVLHVKTARAVKLARAMALMPYEMQSGDAPADGAGASGMRMRDFQAARERLRSRQQQQAQALMGQAGAAGGARADPAATADV